MAGVLKSNRWRGFVTTALRTYLPAWVAQRDAALAIDPYLRGEHALPIASNNRTREEEQALKSIASAPYGRLILNSCTQVMRVKSLRVDSLSGEASDDLPPIWREVWGRNRMASRQNAIYRPAIGYGRSYTSVLPGLLGIDQKPGIELKHYSPKTMTAFYVDQFAEYPALAINGIPQVDGEGKKYHMFEVFDEEAVHYAIVYDEQFMMSDDIQVTYLESRPHPASVTPIISHSPLMDDDGGSRGEIVPFLPILMRIDQTVYDRLLIQRQAAWKVRTASGIKRPDGQAARDRMEAMLRAGDILTSDDPQAKFGTLDASSMAEHVAVHSADLQDLAATSQTPAYMINGETSNIGAESLSAVTSGYHQKITQYQESLDTSLGAMFQLAAHIDSSLGSPDDFYEPRWAGFRPYSLTQVSDALGKLAQQLQIHPDLLFEHVPFFTDSDVDLAKIRLEEMKEEERAQAQQEAAQMAQAQRARSQGSAGDSNQNAR